MEIFEKATVETYSAILDRKVTKLNKIKETFESNLKKDEE